jgi:nucleoside-diphosphate-sugar epimerase
VRIFLAGATGVLGRRLVPLLVAAGHQVTGMTRSPDKVALLVELGADAVVCDVYDPETLTAAVVDARPDLVLHELTDLPDDPQLIAAQVGVNARIRREGTRNLVAAAQAAGAGRFLAQSLAWSVGGDGDAAVADLEEQTLAVGGVVLRYGQFWGEGTYHDHPPEPPRVQIDRAATATVEALDAPSGVITIVDDDSGPADA